MTKMLVLSAQDIAQVFTMEDAVQAVEEAYSQKACGAGRAWPMVYEQFEPGVADMDIRSGELAGSGLFGLKLTAWFSNNPERGLPDIYGTTLLCSNKTGEPLALLNASAITALRTGAAAGVGAKYLARKSATSMLCVGAGHIAPYVIAGTLLACPQVNRVEVWNPSTGRVSDARLDALRKTVDALLSACAHGRTADSYQIAAAENGQAAAGRADIIATVTPACEPVIQNEWVAPGTHLSCVGADMPGKQEIASALAARARLFVDDVEQSVSAGELEIPVAQGAVCKEDIVAELGQVIVGEKPGRESEADITVFDTSGIAVQDLAASYLTYSRAVELGLGTFANL